MNKETTYDPNYVEQKAREQFGIPLTHERRRYVEMRRTVKVRFGLPAGGWLSVTYLRKHLTPKEQTP